MTWYHVKLVARDPAGKKFFIEAESEGEVENRSHELYGEEHEILSLDIHEVPVEDGVPSDFDDSSSTNIAFDSDGNRLKNKS